MDNVKLKHDICMSYLLQKKLFSHSFYIDVMIYLCCSVTYAIWIWTTCRSVTSISGRLVAAVIRIARGNVVAMQYLCVGNRMELQQPLSKVGCFGAAMF